MNTDTLRRALEEAGLTEYQAEAYLALLELGSAPVVTIAERSSVPAPQIYDTIRSLEERGFVETIERDKLHARAREPVDVLDELREKSQMLADAAEEIEDRWERPDAEDYRVNVHKRRETVYGSAREAIEEAQVSVEIATSAEHLGEVRDALGAATERGVVTRVTLCGDAGEVDPDDLDVLEVRQRLLPAPFVAIVDRRQAFFAPTYHHRGEPYGITINDELLSLVLHWFYLTLLWLPCERRYADPEHAPTYISIEGFIRDVAPMWHEGAEIGVRVYGRRPETGETVTIEGTVTHVAAGGSPTVSRHPTITELSGYSTLIVEDDEREYTVGGWGASYEDVEAEVITVESLTLPAP